MKKFLSLVLALVMTMSLVTVSAGAKDFTDSDELSGEQYEEAVNVMSEMGIIDGYAEGDFRPQGTLTRQAAAKIIACMMLGKTTAESLGTSAAPFKDVPAGSKFAGYIAFCVERGLIDGYGDGTFRPTNTLTGFAFLKMLLGALGYDSDIEGYTGTNWTVNVAGRAYEIGLTNGNKDNFTGSKACTREEAALYAVNTLKATLVEYADKGSNLVINGIEVVQGASEPTYVTSNIHDAATSINDSTDNQKNGWTVEFAEKYQPDLALKDTVDAFGRPAHTWTWKKAEIGTYVDFDKMVAEYTTKVTGEDLYDLLGKTAIEDNALFVYVDGEDENLGDAAFGKADMVKKNDETIGRTGNGVLTQVFLDTAEDEITVAVINTYLAIAEEDYDEKNDDVDLTVYYVDNNGTSRKPVYMKTADEDKPQKQTISVDGEDFAITEVAEDDMFLVTVAEGVIQTMDAPEVISDTTISNFRLEKYVTAGGTQYDYADTVMYDEEVLDAYDDANMKDVTYNLILDPYGYMIGIEQNEDPDQYVFLTGIDSKNSNLSVKEADANVIFLDGNMDTVTVNMTKSKLGTALDKADKSGNLSQLNTWCTYTVNSNGVYTLKEVAVSGATSAIDKDKKVDVAQYAQNVGSRDVTIDKGHVSLMAADSKSYVYGNDDTVYLNVELDGVIVEDTNNSVGTSGHPGYIAGDHRWIIDDVESVTTGVKNVNLVMENLTNDKDEDSIPYIAPEAEIYTLYNDDGYVIAAVTIGENEGTSSNYVYVTSSNVNREAYDAETEWTWTREVVVNGELVEISEVGDSLEWIGEDSDHGNMKQGQWYEVKYDANGNVRKVEALATKLNDFDSKDGFINDVVDVETAVDAKDTVVLADTSNVTKLTFKNGTLYTNREATEGFSVSPEVKVVLALAGKNGNGAGKDWFDDVDDSYTGYNGLEKALRDMNSEGAFNAGTVEVSAILENDVATSIIINDKNAPDTKGSVELPEGEIGAIYWGDTQGRGEDAFELRYYEKKLSDSEIKALLESVLGPVDRLNTYMGYVVLENGDMYPVDFDQIRRIAIIVDGTIVGYKDYDSTIDAEIKGMPANTKYIEDDRTAEDYIESSSTGVLTIDEDNRKTDLELTTAYMVKLNSLGNRELADGKPAEMYVAEGETVKITITNAGNYVLSVDGVETEYTDVEDGKEISVEVTGDVVLTQMDADYVTEAQLQNKVDTALKSVNKTATGVDSIKVDGNKVTVVISKSVSDITATDAIKGTGLMTAAIAVIDGGKNSISVQVGDNSPVEISAANAGAVKDFLLSLLKTDLAGDNASTITVTVTNVESGASVTGTVEVSQATE